MPEINLSIDYFENDLAVLEFEDKQLIIPKAWLPLEAQEGDVLSLSLDSLEAEESHLVLRINKNETAKRIKEMQALRDSLVRGPSGDIDL